MGFLNAQYVIKRRKICHACPLYKYVLGQGAICNPDIYFNPETGDVSLEEKEGYVSGCGCSLKSKIKDIESSCPLGKW